MTELEEFANLDVRKTSLEVLMKLQTAKTDEQLRIQRERMNKYKQSSTRWLQR